MKNIFTFYREVGRLKSLYRTGWVKRGIDNPETVAGHMYRSQFIAYDLAQELGEDPVACAFMMMVHDLVEVRTGDITPDCEISQEKKEALERQAAAELAELSGNPEFLEIFIEFQEKKTLRAKLCNDADQLDCVMQALEYAELYEDKRPALENFWPYAEERIQTEPGIRLFQELFNKKQELYKAEKIKSESLNI